MAVVCLCAIARPACAQINVETAVNLGRSSLYYEDYVTAIQHFNDVLLVRPRKAEVYYYRGYAKYALEDYDGAENDCSKAISLNPFRIEFQQLRGLCRINRKDYRGAIDDYSHILRQMPDEQNSRYNRALCHMELKDYGAAREDLNYTLRRWPQWGRAYLVSAQISLEEADTLAAIAWADTLLAKHPHDRDALSLRGRLSLWQADDRKADSLLSAAIACGGRTADNHIARAQARHAMNRYNDALEDYDAAIQLVPEHFVAHYNRGLLRALIGADNLAIEDFDFILKLEPDNTLALYNRALLHEQTGHFAAAESDFTTLIQLYPTFYAGYAARARCRRRQGKTALALQDETVARRADLDIAFGTTRRQPIKQVRRRSEHELDHYQELVEAETDTTRFFISEVAGHIQNRTVEQTLLPPFDNGDVQRLLAELPDDTAARARLRYNSGCMHADIGLTDSAIADFTEAIRLWPRLGQAYYNRALLHIREGRRTEATSDLSRAGELGIYQAYNILKQIRE